MEIIAPKDMDWITRERFSSKVAIRKPTHAKLAAVRRSHLTHGSLERLGGEHVGSMWSIYSLRRSLH
jgi:hypothetical protein